MAGLPSGGTYGTAKSPKEHARAKVISDEMIAVWNKEPDLGLDTIGSAFLTVCLNQENPVEVFNLITVHVASAITTYLSEAAGSA